MRDKKVVKQNLSRKNLQDKVMAALAKKPTRYYLNSRGISSDKASILEGKLLNSKQNLINQRVVKNSKNSKRFLNKSSPKTTAEIKFAFNQDPPERVKKAIVYKNEEKTPEWLKKDEESFDVSIIVPCYKSSKHIVEQIRSWDLLDEGITKEVIYVDDCCPDRSWNAIIQGWEERKTEVFGGIGKILLNDKNLGFAGACNTGAKVAKGKYLIFLNADTKVTTNWVKPMLDCFEEKDVGIVGNMHLRKDGTIDSLGSEWDWKSGSFMHIGRYIYNQKKLKNPFMANSLPDEMKVRRDVQMVTGACFAIPKSVFESVGGFDLAYKVGYWEDADLNMKVKAQGKRIVFTPDSKIYHKVGHSGASSYVHHNRAIFHKKWVASKMIDAYLKTSEVIQENIPSEKIVAYTAINTDYDDLKSIPDICKNVEFIAFMDRERKEEDQSHWKVQPIHNKFSDTNRNAKIHKVLPHLFFPDKEYSLWMDGSVNIVFPFTMQKLIDIYLNDCDLAVFQHPDRNCIYQEANACISRRLDNADVIRAQIQRYTKDGYGSNLGLAECSVLLRRHTPEVQAFNEAWWDEIKNGSRRDQISFNYVANKLNFKFKYLPGDLRKSNYLFKRDNHKRKR